MLVRCDSCDNKINVNAERCPFCGEPNTAGKKQRRKTALIILFVALIAGFCVFEVASSFLTSGRNDIYRDPSQSLELNDNIYSGGELDDYWDTAWQSD